MSTKYRAQILLESDQHKALAEIAQHENRSISDGQLLYVDNSGCLGVGM
jgi:hypothetical protein